MAADLELTPSWEAESATLAKQMESWLAQLDKWCVGGWPDDTGEGWEPIYNPDPQNPQPNYIPPVDGAKIRQSIMNNFKNTAAAVRAAMMDGRANIAKVAAYAPDRLDNS